MDNRRVDLIQESYTSIVSEGFWTAETFEGGCKNRFKAELCGITKRTGGVRYIFKFALTLVLENEKNC